MMDNTDISLDDVRECDETVEVNREAVRVLYELGVLDNTGYAPERYAKSELKESIDEGI